MIYHGAQGQVADVPQKFNNTDHLQADCDAASPHPLLSPRRRRGSPDLKGGAILSGLTCLCASVGWIRISFC